MTEVYVDTSALLPLLDRSDADHAAVTRALTELHREGVSLVTASYVLVEAGALAHRRLGAKAFRVLGEVAQRAMRVVWVDEALHEEAWKRAARASRRGASLVDWVSFLVMEAGGIKRALTLDQHFARRGFEALP